MDHGAFFKLSFLVLLLVTFASFLSPFIAEARQKHAHPGNNGHHRVKYSPLPSQPLSPTTAPVPAPNGGGTPPSPSSSPPLSVPISPSFPEDDEIVTPPPPFDPYNIGTPAVGPPPGYVFPPYQTHGCHYPCTDSNDCDWPCTVCCWNNTCCYDWPELPYE
ncbi:hypothetical protein SOVF_199300 [Spinacia oleracea]|uniref:Protein TRACHEARY ELEMENT DIFFERENTIATION-RELATED 7A-like n=1 Tax=Spinacia oleracea TaxID=3562 RepID=A0A9R0IYA1_SPIOL|nr:protein TRACHEARY ELEMENT DIFFERENTIATION-RELATED 7A-like [Spinacia oleracea]KNA04484.1 hypothetical protein SOVF_199300 [Spinacia oleracea]